VKPSRKTERSFLPVLQACSEQSLRSANRKHRSTRAANIIFFCSRDRQNAGEATVLQTNQEFTSVASPAFWRSRLQNGIALGICETLSGKTLPWREIA
jgi:hypothetical protein